MNKVMSLEVQIVDTKLIRKVADTARLRRYLTDDDRRIVAVGATFAERTAVTPGCPQP